MSALVLGGGLAWALPAMAGPTDPIAMPDDNLRACINASLGASAADPITGTQAAGITEVDCQGEDITDLTGLQTMPLLKKVWLNNNPQIGSRAPLMNLDVLENLGLNNAGVTETDLPGLVQSPKMNYLGLQSNRLADVSALAGSTSVKYLWLADNEIADVSVLASMTNLEQVGLSGQSLVLPAAPLGSATANPVADSAGNPVVVSSSGAGFDYDASGHAWSFSTAGTKTLSWDPPVSLGSASDVTFSGTIRQRITRAHSEPEDPEVRQASCLNGDVVPPQVTLPDTAGITYSIDGDVAPGQKVTIEAVPADDDHDLHVDPAGDWVDVGGDHIYATLEITLDVPDCDTAVPDPTVIDAPNGDLPVEDPCGPGNASWIRPTGADVPDGFTWRIADDGRLSAQADAGYVFSDLSGDLDPGLRDYGYAPDTNTPCPAGTASTPGHQDPGAAGLVLPNTGGPELVAGLLGLVLLGVGGFLVRAGRSPITQREA
ncbi:MAG: hypothetical protein L0H31_02905 [Nocardioidaceae bacterium]|nr:hypothetical protein [Nocardioidaceae bacterium]